MQRRKINLYHIVRLRGFKGLMWDNDHLYVSKGYTLFKMNLKNLRRGNIMLEKIGSYKPDIVRGLASKNRILTRLFRAGFHAVRMWDSEIIGIVAKNIVKFDEKGSKFVSVFKIKRGTRPFGMAVTPEGKLYWGEYFDNKERDEVYVYGSEDGGYSWDIVYTFPKGSIRHIHNIFYDSYENCLWVLTGDYGKEPKIIKFSTDWRTIDIICEGTQQARAASMIFREDKIYYATDTELEQNYIYSIDRKTGKIERLLPLPGPSIFASEAGKYMFVSTHSEPGRLFNPYAFLYISEDGEEWFECLKWRKDKLHPLFFQYGSIILPYGKTPYNYLAATGRAVDSEDGYLNIWKIEE